MSTLTLGDVCVRVCVLADLLLVVPQQGELLLDLAHVAGCLGDLGSLQVPLAHQLLDVLPLLLQRLLKRRGARDLTAVPGRRPRQLGKQEGE